MSRQLTPLLIQFAVPPSGGAGGPLLEVDRSTGLLRQPGAMVPFIEELLQKGEEWRSLVAAETVLTEATDPNDPDLVRSESAWHRFGGAPATHMTRGTLDPSDPDLVRSDSAWHRFSEALSTNVTKADTDPTDPDLVRMAPFR